MSRSEVLAFLRSLGVGEARDLLVESKTAIGWSFFADEGEEVWPDENADEEDAAERGQLRGLGGERIAAVSRLIQRGSWSWSLDGGERGIAASRADAQARVEDAAVAAGYVLPWRAAPSAPLGDDAAPASTTTDNDCDGESAVLARAETRLREVLAVFYGEQADRAAALDEETWRGEVLAYLARVHGAAGLTWARQARPEPEDALLIEAGCDCLGNRVCPVCQGFGWNENIEGDKIQCPRCEGDRVVHLDGCPAGGGE